MSSLRTCQDEAVQSETASNFSRIFNESAYIYGTSENRLFPPPRQFLGSHGTREFGVGQRFFRFELANYMHHFQYRFHCRYTGCFKTAWFRSPPLIRRLSSRQAISEA
jgi:hypothetical protein